MSITTDKIGFAIPVIRTKKKLQQLLENYASESIYILVDENTNQLLPKLIKEILKLKNATIIKINSGEENKNLETSLYIWQFLSDKQVKKNALLINFGGGVITDIGGFIASTFKRGIDFLNIPTTLLAMTDAAIGGKTGIDLDNFKNQIGVINSPIGIYYDSAFLSSLPKRELTSGFAEVLKHGLVKNKEHWNYCTNNDFSELNWEKVISDSIAIKGEVVRNDPHEKGERKLLNFGHTIGHAIETHMMNQKTPVLHGEAVAAGMICESFISLRLEQLSEHELSEISNRITNIFPKINIEKTSYNSLFELMKNDKKNNSSDINFTLLSCIGKGLFDKTAPKDLIFESLDYYMKIKK